MTVRASRTYVKEAEYDIWSLKKLKWKIQHDILALDPNRTHTKVAPVSKTARLTIVTPVRMIQ